MPEWEGQLDVTATTRFYLKIAHVQCALPFSKGRVSLHSSSASTPMPQDQGSHSAYPFFLEISGLRGGDAMVALGDARHTLLLWCDTSIDPGPRICHDSTGTSIFDRRSDFEAHWGHYDDSLPADALEAMAKHAPTVYRVNRGYAFNPFANSYRLYTAGLRLLPPDVALVSFVSALEGLFTTSSDNISYRFALAIACLLESSWEQRAFVMNQAKQVYSARSKTVHGAPIDKDLERTAISLSESLTPQAQQLCRRSFRRLLELNLADFVRGDRSGKRDQLFTLLALGYSLAEAATEMNIQLGSAG